MIDVHGRLDERKREFASYYRLLRHVERRLLPRSAGRRRVGDLPSPETFKAMKATAFLMIYNITEATIIGAIAELYAAIGRDGCKLVDVRDEIRSMWIEQKFRLSPNEATPATYRTRAAEMVRQTMDGVTLVLDTNLLSLAGNIDGELARNICRRHGCPLRLHKRSRGGAELHTVKQQRNGLAHGDKSFAECGQSYVVSDIDRIARECFAFLSGFVRSVEKFVNDKEYLRT